jgi:ferredoxin
MIDVARHPVADVRRIEHLKFFLGNIGWTADVVKIHFAQREERAAMRVTVDHEVCQGHAICNALDPARFPLDDLGYSALGSAQVADGDEAAVRRVVDACPERALSVTP